MYSILAEYARRPPLFSVYTAEELWTDPHLAQQMLAFHLDPDQDLASRNHAFVKRSLGWLNERFELGGGRRVLDLGCGPGLYANALAELGASVTGVDFSQNSLAYGRSEAESRGLDVVYEHGNYLEIDLQGTFDLILLIFGDFCPLDPHFVFNKRFKYEAELAYLDRYLVVEAGRRREFFNWIQCYDPPALKRELGEAGWDLEATFGNVAGDPFDPDGPFFAVIAEPTA